MKPIEKQEIKYEKGKRKAKTAKIVHDNFNWGIKVLIGVIITICVLILLYFVINLIIVKLTRRAHQNNNNSNQAVN